MVPLAAPLALSVGVRRRSVSSLPQNVQGSRILGSTAVLDAHACYPCVERVQYVSDP